jgi:hypothetical protein
MKTTFAEQVQEIRNICKENKAIGTRIFKIKEAGYEMTDRGMGPGGVGQIRSTTRNTFVQVTAGYGRANVASVVVLPLYQPCSSKIQ